MERAAALYRPFVYSAIGGLVISGTYNLLTNPGHRPIYHMLLGIKLLLALHVFAVAILIVQPQESAARPHDDRAGHFGPRHHRHLGLAAPYLLN